MEHAEPVQAVARQVVIDLDRCIECRSCAAACHYGHPRMPAVHSAQGGVALLPLICRQCKSAACVDACPNEAMVCDEAGVVRRRLFRCTGCGSCVLGCPFGVIADAAAGEPLGPGRPAEGPADARPANGHVVAKCDLCRDLMAEQADWTPRCVAACPSGALMFAEEPRVAAAGLTMVSAHAAGQHPLKRR